MMWMLLFSANALASTASGLGLTPMGGGFAGVTEPGPLGLVSTPSSAHTESVEVVLDVGANMFQLGGKLDGFERETYRDAVPMPYLGATLPIGNFGVGMYAMIPYGGGIDLEPQSSHRFHSRTSQSFLVELGLPVAYKVNDWLTVGSSFRAARATLEKTAAMNTAALVNSKVDLDPALPVDNELLVGSQDVSINGYGLGFGLGASFFLPNDVEFHLGYRSPIKTNLSGPVEIVPSDGIDARLTGTAMGSMQFSTEIELGAVVPIGKTRLALMAGWVDWSPLSTIDIEVTDLQISSSEAALISLLTTTGLNESDLLAAGTDIKNDLGHSSVFHGGATVGVPIGEKWEVRPGAFYSPTTMPDSTFHIGVADFTSWNFRIAASYELTQWLTAGLSYDHFLVNTRTIRTSGLSLGNEAKTGRVLPSANGIYDMSAQRAGLSLMARM